MDEPTGYGRIIRDVNGNVVGIVEEKDANDAQKEIQEVNTGIFCFKNKSLLEGLPLLTNQNAQNEYYLTDLVDIFTKQKKKFGSYVLYDSEQVMGINTLKELVDAEYVMLKRCSYLWGIKNKKIL